MLQESIIVDKQNFDFCAIDSAKHIENCLGSTLAIPDELQDKINDLGLTYTTVEADVLTFLKEKTGMDYVRWCRDNTYNHETDLDQFFVYTIYVPESSTDPIWASNAAVFIEMGSPGDPRYVYYTGAELHLLQDGNMAESGFFNWVLNWHATPLNSSGPFYGYISEKIDEINTELDTGSTNYPTSRLRDMCYSDPLWVEKQEGFVGRVKDMKRPLVFYPMVYYP